MIKTTPEQLSTELDTFLEYETLYNKLCEEQRLVDFSMFDGIDANGNPIKDVINLRFDVKKLILLAKAATSEAPYKYQRRCIERFDLGLDALHNYPHIKPLVNQYLIADSTGYRPWKYDPGEASKLLKKLQRANYSPRMVCE